MECVCILNNFPQMIILNKIVFSVKSQNLTSGFFFPPGDTVGGASASGMKAGAQSKSLNSVLADRSPSGSPLM